MVYAVIAEFDAPEAVLAAARSLREDGYTRLDAFTPFPVHGLEEALGIPRSRLGYLVAAMGAIGCAGALLLQWWTGAIGYPLVIGGKPLFAFEFSIPITFELTVLLASFGAVIGMLALNGLPRLNHPAFNYPNFHRATDDRFLLAVEAADPKFDPQAVRRRLEALGALRVESVEDEA